MNWRLRVIDDSHGQKTASCGTLLQLKHAMSNTGLAVKSFGPNSTCANKKLAVLGYGLKPQYEWWSRGVMEAFVAIRCLAKGLQREMVGVVTKVT